MPAWTVKRVPGVRPGIQASKARCVAVAHLDEAVGSEPVREERKAQQLGSQLVVLRLRQELSPQRRLSVSRESLRSGCLASGLGAAGDERILLELAERGVDHRGWRRGKGRRLLQNSFLMSYPDSSPRLRAPKQRALMFIPIGGREHGSSCPKVYRMRMLSIRPGSWGRGGLGHSRLLAWVFVVDRSTAPSLRLRRIRELED